MYRVIVGDEVFVFDSKRDAILMLEYFAKNAQQGKCVSPQYDVLAA